MGGRPRIGETVLTDERLWVEWASRQTTGNRSGEDIIRTFQSEERFFALLVSILADAQRADMIDIADIAVEMLEQGSSPEYVAKRVIEWVENDPPGGRRMPFAIIDVAADQPGALQMRLADCDAPPLFMTRRTEASYTHTLFLPPVLEDLYHGHLLRLCQLRLQDGDHLAMVSEGYVRARGGTGRWVWKDIATYTRRLSATGCSAAQLLDAMFSTYRRRALSASAGEGEAQERKPVSVVAMYVRPVRTVTVWTGPPADPAQDEEALGRLMDEAGARVICGDTSAQIAARHLEADLELEPRPAHGWIEVPPLQTLTGVDLVTEGLVTMGKALERMTGAAQVNDLPRTQDGATRLARILLAADCVYFIVGLAVNPQQIDESGEPLRRGLVEKIAEHLKARAKVVSIAYL
jgi:hypothetical protein